MEKKLTLAMQEENYYKDYNIDPRTISMIVEQYIYMGEKSVKLLTDELLDAKLKELQKEEDEAKKHNSFSLITPEFNIYILRACQGLAKCDVKLRNRIIKKHLI